MHNHDAINISDYPTKIFAIIIRVFIRLLFEYFIPYYAWKRLGIHTAPGILFKRY